MKAIVDINGRQYDARTGTLLSKATKPAGQPLPAASRGTFIDGVSRRKPKNIQNQSQTSTTQPAFKKQLEDGKLFAKTEKSKTFIREAVKKPFGIRYVSETKPNLKFNLINKVSDTKAQRAGKVNRNGQISHYSKQAPPKTKIATLPIAEERVNNNFFSAPPAIVGKILGQKQKSTTQVFEHKIQNADNHLNQPLPKDKLSVRIARHVKINPKLVSIGAVCLLIFVLGSYFAYIKIPAIAMKVAANKAGFEGHLPSNIPAGYSFKGPIKTINGSIVVSYKSNSDTRQFAIVQKPTNWSSESLLTNFLVDSKLQYQTYHDSGLTVYVYNEGQATWVDKGIWYTLNGQNSLSSDQILAIASSL